MNEFPYPGDELRQRRESLGLSTRDVSAEVRIPIAYVEALEQGDFEALPALGYALGFLRTYCMFLDLPPERYLDGLRASALVLRPGPPVLVGRPASRAATWKENVLSWAAICGILLLAWLTYAAVVRPDAGITEKRVEAGSREVTASPSLLDAEF